MIFTCIEKEILTSDIEDVEPELGKNLRWILDNNIEDLYLTFTHEVELMGKRIIVELRKGGADMFIDNTNKTEYVMEICKARMLKEIAPQAESFLKGFYLILPYKCLCHLTTGELEMIMSGAPKIDLEDMKMHTELEGYNKNSQIIKWFWEVLGEFTQEELAAFLYFLSGSLSFLM